MDSVYFYMSNPRWYYYVMQKKCVKCGKTKPVSEFNFKNKKLDLRNGRCRLCTRVEIMAAYYKNRPYYLQYRAQLNLRNRQKIANTLYSYLSAHPCVDCGLDDPIVLEFDHVYGKKLMAVSSMVRRGYPLKKILDEVKKCQVRCANCHARKTAKDFKYYYYVLKEKTR